MVEAAAAARGGIVLVDPEATSGKAGADPEEVEPVDRLALVRIGVLRAGEMSRSRRVDAGHKEDLAAAREPVEALGSEGFKHRWTRLRKSRRHTLAG